MKFVMIHRKFQLIFWRVKMMATKDCTIFHLRKKKLCSCCLVSSLLNSIGENLFLFLFLLWWRNLVCASLIPSFLGRYIAKFDYSTQLTSNGKFAQIHLPMDDSHRTACCLKIIKNIQKDQMIVTVFLLQIVAETP